MGQHTDTTGYVPFLDNGRNKIQALEIFVLNEISWKLYIDGYLQDHANISSKFDTACNWKKEAVILLKQSRNTNIDNQKLLNLYIETNQVLSELYYTKYF